MLESEKALQRSAEAAMDMARAAGADAVMAWVSATRSTSCEVRNGKLDKMQENNRRSLALELYVNGRYAVQSTNDLREDELADFVERAVALTRALERDPHRRLADPSLLARRQTAAVPTLESVDPSIRALGPGERLRRCMEIDARVTTTGTYVSRETWMTDGEYLYAGAGTNGFSGVFGATVIALGAALTMADGDKNAEDSTSVAARHAEDLPSTTWLANEAARLVQNRVGSRKGPTMTASMVVDRQAMPRLLAWLLAPTFGDAIQQGKSFWMGKLGQRLVSPSLVLVDDPHIPRALGSDLFDGDGLPTKKRTLIEDGALQTFLIDVYYANKLGVEPTTGSTTNLVVTPGSKGRDALIAGVERGVYVTDWLGGNCDSSTGDFSVGLRGHLIEKGALIHAVSEMNLTGNILSLFERVVAIGNDTWEFSTVRSPSVLFDAVSFSGA